MGFSDSFFNRVEKKTNVGKDTITLFINNFIRRKNFKFFKLFNNFKHLKIDKFPQFL